MSSSYIAVQVMGFVLLVQRGLTNDGRWLKDQSATLARGCKLLLNWGCVELCTDTSVLVMEVVVRSNEEALSSDT
jgi:hypothetical protein